MTTQTPRTAVELVAGDPASLRQAADWFTSRAESATEVRVAEVATAAATAHRTLAEALAQLQERARAVYVRAEEVGIGDRLLAGRDEVPEFVKAHPEREAVVSELVAEAVDLRLAWVDAQHDFIDAVLPLGELLGWEFSG